MLVRVEGNGVPWPRGWFLLKGEGAGPRCHGQGWGKQGSERLFVPEGQKAHNWGPKTHTLTPLASRGWTKVPISLEDRSVRH